MKNLFLDIFAALLVALVLLIGALDYFDILAQ